jgi:hypothetical protein
MKLTAKEILQSNEVPFLEKYTVLNMKMGMEK